MARAEPFDILEPSAVEASPPESIGADQPMADTALAKRRRVECEGEAPIDASASPSAV
jgi:hypothetical protein